MQDIKGIKTVSDLVERLEADADLKTMFDAKPTEVLRAADTEIRDNAPTLPNVFIYQAAVIFVGLTLLITIIGAFALLRQENATDTPEWVIAVTSAGIGALAGMLRT